MAYNLRSSKFTLLTLPTEVLTYILIKLDKHDLRNLMLTCKFLKEFIKNNNTVWRSQPHEQMLIFNSLGSSKRDYFTVFDRCRISFNWRKGIYRNKILLRHNENFMPWLKFHNSEILLMAFGSKLHGYKSDRTGTPDCKKAAWEVIMPTVERHDVRTNDISRFVFKDGFLVCGNRDGCFAVYKAEDITKSPQLMCHVVDCHNNGYYEVTAVEMINRKTLNPTVVSGSNNCSTLKMFSIKSDKNPKTFNDVPMFSYDNKDITNIEVKNGRGFSCMHLNSMNDRLIVGLYENSKPILIDVNTGTVMMTQNGSRNVVRDVQWHDNNVVVYVTYFGMLQCIDTRTHQVVFDTFDPFQSSLYCVKTDGFRSLVVGASEYCRCSLFDIRYSKGHLQLFYTQKRQSPVYSLDFDSTKLIAAVDRNVAVLNFDDMHYGERKDYSQQFQLIHY